MPVFLHLHRPGPPLDRFVELVTYYADFQPDHSMERLLPDGAVELIVDLTEAPKKLHDSDDPSRFRSFRHAWLSGMRHESIVIEAAPGSSMAVIRFRPGGALPFLGFAVDGVTDVVEPLGVVLGERAMSLRERILEAPTVPLKMAAVEAWLLERSRGRLEANPVVEYLTTRLFAPAGLRITDVVAEVGYSQRHVLGLFQRWVGMAPKQYHRIRRFQQVLHDVTAEARAADLALALELRGRPAREPDWADLALAHGYYDQSHLARDFRELARVTPGEYVRRYRGLVNYLPIG
jgi:AraC-like DNA-binding protein